MTIEAIDLCLEHHFISLNEHTAWLKFRWLYFMKFGFPCILSRDLTECKGRNIEKFVDPEVLKEAEQIYSEILKGLDFIKVRQLVVDICIFNIFPNFLYNKYSMINTLQLKSFERGIKLVYSLLELYQYLHRKFCKNILLIYAYGVRSYRSNIFEGLL